MRKYQAVLCCIVILVGILFIYVSIFDSNNKFGDTVSEMGALAQPEMNAVNEAINNRNFSASQYHCHQLITIIDTYNPRLAEIQVSAKYEPSKQHMISAYDHQRTACGYLMNSSDGNITLPMQHFSQASEDFDWVVSNWPD